MSWYQHWFADALYMELYAHRDAAEARQAIDLFELVTGLRGNPSENYTPRSAAHSAPLLLDLACGTGRHAFEMARRGFRVAAADLSPTLLAAASRKTQRYADRLHLVRADMRRLPFPARFDGVLQLFTAFGYFHRDEDNEAIIAGVRTLLLPGGWYMLDFLNADALSTNIEAHSEQETAEGRIIMERSIRNGRVEKHIRILNNGQERTFLESVRLFTLDDFRGMFNRCGFALRDVRGGYDGAAFNASSPRCIMFARRET